MPKGISKAAAKIPSIHNTLKAEYGDLDCPLEHHSPFQLLVCAILSAQCTDKKVNSISPSLFETFPDAKAMSKADPARVERVIRSIGLAKTKSKNIVNAAKLIMENFGGRVPDTMEELTTLSGVGRKTANVLLGHAFDKPGFPADTHVIRLANRIGFAKTENPAAIERIVNNNLPPEQWCEFSLLLIHHGRNVCKARTPQCDTCVIANICEEKKKKMPRKAAKGAERGKNRAKSV